MRPRKCTYRAVIAAAPPRCTPAVKPARGRCAAAPSTSLHHSRRWRALRTFAHISLISGESVVLERGSRGPHATREGRSSPPRHPPAGKRARRQSAAATAAESRRRRPLRSEPGMRPSQGPGRAQALAVRGVAERREPVQVPHPRDVGAGSERAAASLALTALGLTGRKGAKVDIALDGAW